MSTECNKAVEQLVNLSRRYGGDPAFVLAGGGNTSVKDGNTLYVKASGTSLATIDADGFVAMDRPSLARLADASLSEDPDERERLFKERIYQSRLEPEKGQRPSVEVLLHDLMPGRFVVHTHATAVNALSCARDGEAQVKALFGDEVLWLPYVDPGFILAQQLKSALAERSSSVVIMQNHGLIVSGESPEDIDERTTKIIDAVQGRLGEDWPTGGYAQRDSSKLQAAEQAILQLGPMLRAVTADSERLHVARFDDSAEIMALVNDPQWRDIAMGGPLIPDQIVYCTSFPMCISWDADESDAECARRLQAAVQSHRETYRFAPKVVLVEQLGLFAIAETANAAATVAAVYRDAARIMSGARQLGGVAYMNERDRRFIEDWEVEAYRKQVGRTASEGRASGKVAVVTGAAQGFGLEIAEHLAAEQAHVALVDLNAEGATAAAERITSEHGPGRAVGLAINVTDADSIHDALVAVVRQFGGFDLFVSNAGVLKAASVKTLAERDFDFVTSVNYKGFFLCTQHAAPIMARQRQVKPDYHSDIIQINSKSGLVGSNKNGAYAGSKFGGIGLVQSFALELVEDGIKVNAICPGNFFDGPLWSDPEKGLFVQYLNTGKVPGAKTVEDVKRAYEAKVPMGRGCRTPDVVRAILYLMEQQYETGQALPVTGGQVMLN